jgi:NAD(P)H-hydrate epimerase
MPVPVINVTQMRQWEDQTWTAGKSQTEVIQQAGQAVARYLLEITSDNAPILVLAGHGHNGDDARAAAAHLPNRQVTLISVQNPHSVLDEVERWLKTHRTANLAWILDGLFGIGLNRPLEGSWLDLIRLVNQSDVPVLALDVPSGLNADTGEIQGTVMMAEATLTLAAPKQGLLAPQAINLVGRLMVAPDIGLIPCVLETEVQWTLPEDFSNYPPRRPVNGHKGRFGHLCIIAGSQGYHGAAVLAALGAQRAQPGLISLIVPEDVYVPIASQLRSTMVHPWQPGMWDDDDFTAILFGPGLANYDLPADLKREVCHAWSNSPLPVIADASALDWLPKGLTCPDALRVITPHPGEAARMLSLSTTEIQADRPKALRELSGGWGRTHVVLKGHQTLVGSANGPIFINPTGNPHLAQGGAGDVLAGWMAGLLAQPTLQEDALKTIRYAVYTHGQAADRLTKETRHWIIDELFQKLG